MKVKKWTLRENKIKCEKVKVRLTADCVSYCTQKQNNLGWKWKWTLNHLSIWYFFFFISPSSTSPIPIRLGRQRQQIHLIIICLFFLFFHHYIGLGWNSNLPLGYFANLDQASRSSEIVWVKRFLQDRANLKSFCSDAGCFFLEKFLQDFGQKLFWGEGSAGIVMPLVHFCLLLFSPRHNKCNYGPHPFL